MREARLRVKALTIVALLLTTAAYGQVGGDPPYLLENGWKPLLNGNDLGGWVGENGKPTRLDNCEGRLVGSLSSSEDARRQSCPGQSNPERPEG